MDKSIASSPSAVVAADGSGDYLSLIEALASNETNIFVKNGIYNVSSTVLIQNHATKIQGESVEHTILRQTDPSKDLITINANDVSITRLTLDSLTHSAQAALVIASSNRTRIEGNKILGTASIFAVYFAGPKVAAGAETIAAVEENHLDNENVFENNTVYSDFIGDGISFSLQKNGKVRYNNVFGSSISFYMCRDSEVLGNLIKDSPLSGISYSLPAYNNRIERNIILRSINSGIRVSRNLEHPISLSSRYHGLEIVYNIILDTRFFGIELDQLSGGINVMFNTIDHPDFSGIQVLRCSKINISSNNISNFGAWKGRGKIRDWTSDSNGIYLETDVQQSSIHLNEIISNGNGDFGIRVTKETSQNRVYFNQNLGTYVQYSLCIEGNNFFEIILP
ncbi:right-handed parallel beta-helix repeat-containing protein [Paenibacillus sp. RC343]|uniref:right-handed parallel beta-helix repeat-containing protein n=1 Tax=Paenibacillus sp. RC343 TaxID=3045841 RepID=UPI0024BA798E|nr:right-handed parallel beta-helix repeat-containing protein [Paenibacillus sp. RC343]